MRQLLFVLFVAAAACHAQTQPTKEVTLPSGKRVKVIAVGKLSFTNDSPALMLKYQTDLKISDLPALRKEVNEIWSVFKTDVENANLANAIISANEAPQGFMIQKAKGYNFVFKKSNDRWELLSNPEKPPEKSVKQ